MAVDTESETKIGFYISCDDHIEFYTSLVRAGISYREFFEPIIKRHINGKPIYKGSTGTRNRKAGEKKSGNTKPNQNTKADASRVIRRKRNNGTGIV
jgi:hypothetical protein